MNTQKLIPALILIAATAFVAPSASAERHSRTVQVAFSYDRTAPAEVIYKRLNRTAERACHTPGPIAFKTPRAIRTCKASLLNAVIDKIQRVDVAAVHHRSQPFMVASNN